jgi:hypothetical protein
MTDEYAEALRWFRENLDDVDFSSGDVLAAGHAKTIVRAALAGATMGTTPVNPDDGERAVQCDSTWPLRPTPETGHAACHLLLDHYGLHMDFAGRTWADESMSDEFVATPNPRADRAALCGSRSAADGYTPQVGDSAYHSAVGSLPPTVMLLPLGSDGFPVSEARLVRDVAATPLREGVDRYLVVFVPRDRDGGARPAPAEPDSSDDLEKLRAAGDKLAGAVRLTIRSGGLWEQLGAALTGWRLAAARKQSGNARPVSGGSSVTAESDVSAPDAAPGPDAEQAGEGARGNCSRPGGCPMHYNCGRCDSPSANEAASPFVDDITGTTVDVTTVRRRRWGAEQAGGEQT